MRVSAAAARDARSAAHAPSHDEPAWVRRRRLAAAFGDTLPETTADERAQPEAATPRAGTDPARDAWLRNQVPPHHG